MFGFWFADSWSSKLFYEKNWTIEKKGRISIDSANKKKPLNKKIWIIYWPKRKFTNILVSLGEIYLFA